jgi:ribonuclease P protein component
MLARKNRLPTPLCEKVLKTGKKVHTAHLSCAFLPCSQDEWCASVVVSKKTEKSAVQRNVLTRRTYEIIAKHHTVLAGKWCMFILRKGSNTLTFSELEKEVLEVVKKF